MGGEGGGRGWGEEVWGVGVRFGVAGAAAARAAGGAEVGGAPGGAGVEVAAGEGAAEAEEEGAACGCRTLWEGCVGEEGEGETPPRCCRDAGNSDAFEKAAVEIA